MERRGGPLTSADDQPTLVSGDGEGHLPARRTPVALAPASASAPRGHARTPRRAWGTTLQDREEGENAGRRAGPVCSHWPPRLARAAYPEALEEVIDDPRGVLAPVWGPHDVRYLLRTCPVI